MLTLSPGAQDPSVESTGMTGKMVGHLISKERGKDGQH